jgi:glycosyltransferase involved in cell wall biosynthesis
MPIEPTPDEGAGAADCRSIAVLVPCHNEAATVAGVVRDFRAALPGAEIVVIDNASVDETARIAREAGARVVRETRKGKGFALQRGLEEVPDADFVVMVDGDGTYSGTDAPRLLAAARDGADMVIGTRLASTEEGAFPPGHSLGNRAFSLLVQILFRRRTQDVFSGYRVLSRRFLDKSPVIAQGFEIETELSVQAFVGQFLIDEIPVRYGARPSGSVSKLHTYRDGYRILVALLAYFRDYRPLTFFGGLSILFGGLGLVGGGVVVAEFLESGRILRLPLAVLSTTLLSLGALSLTIGVILSAVFRRTAELAALFTRQRKGRS